MTSPLPIVYLYTSDAQGIRGSIRFQKLVFLGQQESDLPERYRFVPYKYGPYSYQLERDIHSGMDDGYISRNRTRNAVGNYRIDYSLTPDGIRLAKSLLKRERFEKLFRAARTVTSTHGGKSLSDLIRYVYGNYPKYTDESTLDIDRIFNEATTSQFSEPDASRAGPFDQIEKLSEQEGKIAGTGNGFVRQSLEIGSEFRVILERISGNSLSIYWESSSPSFDSFKQVVQNDPAISEDRPSEMRTCDTDDWVRGNCAGLLDLADTETCLFFRTNADDDQYTVTWEAGRGANSDEVTIQMAESQVDYEKLRAALVQYATATALDVDVAPRSRVDTTDEMITESFRQTAKLAIS